jgi:hypothetical protein
MPYRARDITYSETKKKSIFAIIGALLIITATLQFPIAGLLAYSSTIEGVEFGGTLDLQGTITDSHGMNLSGVRISIIGTSLTTVSDEEGQYTIFGAPNGIWRIEAQRDGYRGETRRVIVHELLFNEVNFELETGSGNTEVNELWFFITLSILTLMFSIFVIAGAWYSFKGQRFTFVLVGAILGLFTMSAGLAFWFLPIVFFLAIIGFFTSMCALLLTVWHRKDFGEWVPPGDDS